MEAKSGIQGWPLHSQSGVESKGVDDPEQKTESWKSQALQMQSGDGPLQVNHEAIAYLRFGVRMRLAKTEAKSQDEQNEGGRNLSTGSASTQRCGSLEEVLLPHEGPLLPVWQAKTALRCKVLGQFAREILRGSHRENEMLES